MEGSTERTRLVGAERPGPGYGSSAGPDEDTDVLPTVVVSDGRSRPSPTAGGSRAMRRQASLENVDDAVTLSWNNVNVHVTLDGDGGCCRRKPRETKHILRDVTGMVPPGKLVAIMGASGAGKSTLINVLTHRNLANLTVDGDILVNGAKIGPGIKSVSAYVQQDDLFIASMKVREQLWFTAMLRMDSDVTTEDRNLRVDMVMQELGLTKCADAMIGTAGGKKSISGGERKRLAFASEILTNPALLFCDEPTSGLDSYMALSVVQTLKRLASLGKTVLCTIHQPSSDIFIQFDDLILLAEGRVGYMGSSKGAIEFFDTAGFPCPSNYNPADHYIHTLAVTPGEEEQSLEKINRIVNANRQSPAYQEIVKEVTNQRPSDHFQNELDKIKNRSPYKASYWRQFWVVLWRCWVTHIRDPVVFRGRVMQNVGIGLLVGLIYLQQNYDQKGVMNINGALFLLQIGASLGNIFAVINVFPLEYPIFVREHQNGMYTVFFYYVGKVLSELPTFLILPVVLATIAYWMIGLYPAAYNFGIHVATLVLIANTSISFGYMMSTMSSNVGLILAVAPMLQLPLMLFGGFFLNADSVPVYLIWLKYLSWFNYANEILVVEQWKDVTNITCDVPMTNVTSSPSGGLCYRDGQAVIRMMSYDENRITLDFGILVVLLVVFRIMAYILLAVRTSLKK